MPTSTKKPSPRESQLLSEPTYSDKSIKSIKRDSSEVIGRKTSQSGKNEGVCDRCPQCPFMSKKAERLRRNMERVEMLARPNARRLRDLWDEKCELLPRERRDKIKSALEDDYFLSPEQTEQYFLALGEASRIGIGTGTRKDVNAKNKELRQRQTWLVNFSAQVAYRLCDYISKGEKEMLVSNRLRSIADVVLERIADILGEPKPTRTNSGRLARFMVAVSDRIAVWIENVVYRADACEPIGLSKGLDDHIRLDAEPPYKPPYKG